MNSLCGPGRIHCRAFVGLFVFLILFLRVGVETALAAPADPTPSTLVQPDGTKFQARLLGDEHFHYYLTESGYPIVRDPETKWWHYAMEVEEGIGSSSGGRVGVAEKPARTWTPRVPKAELEARKTRYVNSGSVPTAFNGASFNQVAVDFPLSEAGVQVQNANIAMLLTTFADTSGLTHLPAGDFETEYFNTDPSSFSARELFREMSYGQHLISSGPGGIVDWAAAPNNRVYYGDRTPYASGTTREDGSAIQELVKWRVGAVSSDFDWGPYDVDNDGWVDLVCLVFQGGSQSQAGGRVEDLWPIRFSLDPDPSNPLGVWNTGDVNAEGEPVLVRDFIIVPERGSDGAIKTVGTFCHEYGHGIGWPDLYDNDSSSEGVGRFCVMGTGGFNTSPGGRSGDRPPWANPWCRAACGWVSPENLTANLQGRTLRPANEENVVLRMWSAGSFGSEYYLLENRKKTGFDIDLPDEGLFIWHINEGESNNTNEWWSIPGTGNELTLGSYAVALEQADGLFEMERNLNAGGSGDAFRDGDVFDSNSVPSSDSLGGSPTAVAVRNVRTNIFDDVTADFFVQADFAFPSIGEFMPESSSAPVYVVNQLSGQASDNVEVTRVEVAFRRLTVGADTEWYNWLTSEWDTVGGDYDPALSSLYEKQAVLGPPLGGAGDLRDWSVAIDPNDVTPGSYSIVGRSTDSSGAVSGWRYSYFEVGENPSAPEVSFSEPSVWENFEGALPNFTGSAINVTAPFRVDVALQADGGSNDGEFYNWTTAGWGGGFTNQHITSDTASPWSIDMTARTLPSGTYILYARVENSDQVISGWRSRRFRVGQPAEVRVTRPAHADTVRSLSDIGGIIVEPSGTGVQNDVVLLTLRNALGEYWDGGSWIGVEATLTGQISGTHWSMAAVPPVDQLNDGPFEIRATMTTNTGEMPLPVPGVSQTSFTVDNLPPVVTITSPIHESTINSSPLPVFEGTAVDPGGIGYVNCYLRRDSDGAYWTGYTWTFELQSAPGEDDPHPAPSVAVLEGSHGGGNWSCLSPLPLPRIHMENGGYHFIVIVADRAGNFVQVDSAITLDYHQIFHWTGNGLTDNWADASNWSPYGIPGVEDYAQIGNGGTVFSNVDRTVRGMKIVNGSVVMNGNTLTTTHDSFWEAGWLSGELHIEPGANWEIRGSGTKTIGDGTVIDNQGLVDWQGPGAIRGEERNSGWTWNNLNGGVFRISGGGAIFSTWYGNHLPVFNNQLGARIDLATDGSLATWSRMRLNNASDLFLQGGTLSMTNNTVNLDPGSALAGFATLVLNTGVNINTRVFSSAAVSVTGGWLQGAGVEPAVWAGPGIFTWHAGDLWGQLTFESGTTSLLAGGGQKQLRDEAELINEGEMRWSGAGNIRAESRNEISTLRNRGTFIGNTGADLVEWYGNKRPVFINEAGATFRKQGPGSMSSQWEFVNAGDLRIDDGSLNLLDGGAQDGPIAVEEDGLIYFSSGSFPHADGVTYSGSGRMINDATIGAAGTINNELLSPGFIQHRNGWMGLDLVMDGPGRWEWTGGFLWGSVTVPAGSELLIENDDLSGIKQCADESEFHNFGSVVFSGSALRAQTQNGTPFQFYNKSGGVFEVTGDGGLMTLWYGNSKPTFHNEAGARIIKSGGSGRSTWNSYHLENASEIAVETGEIAFSANTVNLNPGTTVTGAGILEFNTGLYLKTRVHTTAAIEMIGGFLSSGGTESAVWAGPGLISWSGGDLWGKVTLEAGTTSRILGAAQKQLRDEAELVNEGVLTWTDSGNIRAQSQNEISIIRNRGTFVADTGADFSEWFGNKRPMFVNESSGLFRKEGGGNLSCSWGFDSAGTVEVEAGELNLGDGGQIDGDFLISDGALCRYSQGSFAIADGVSFGGGGRVINEATIAGAGVINNELELTGSFEHRAGWLGSNVTLDGPGAWLWTGGSLWGTLFIPSGSSFRMLDSPSDRYCADECVLENSGLLTWEGGSAIRSQTQSGNPFQIINRNGAIFRITGNGNLFSLHFGNTKPVFENEEGARIEKTGGDGYNSWTSFHLNNHGEIAVALGGLGFAANTVNLYHDSTVTGDGGLRFNSALYLRGRVHTTAKIEMTGGYWVGQTPGAGVEPSIWAGTGVITWLAGQQYGPVTLESGTVSLLAGAGEKYFHDGAELINEGTMSWTGGQIRAQTQSGTPARIRNRGRFSASCPDGMTIWFGNTTARFINEGVLNLGGRLSMGGWAFDQTATGSLYVDLGGPVPGDDFDQVSSNKGCSIDGVLVARTVPGYSPPPATEFPVVSASGLSGVFSGVVGSYTESYEPGQVILTSDGDENAYLEFIEEYFPGESDPAIVGMEADPDGDGIKNLGEFAFGGNPNDGSSRGRTFVSLIDTNGNGQDELVLTVATRTGVSFSNDVQPLGSHGDLQYQILGWGLQMQADGELSQVPALHPSVLGVPDDLSPDYSYHSFVLDGSDGLPNAGFASVAVTHP